MKEYNCCELMPGGKLIWHALGTSEKDVTNDAISFLWERVVINKDATINDLFLLINNDIEIFEKVIRCYLKDYIEEAFSKESELSTDLNYIEFYWNPIVSESYKDNKTVIDGISFPYVHGVSDKEKYCISGMRAYNIKQLSIKLKKEYVISDEFSYYKDAKSKGFSNLSYRDYNVQYDYCEYTLGGIIRSLFYELSFFGPPKVREEKIAELNDRVEEAKSNPESFISSEEVFKIIRERIKDKDA